MTTRDAFADEFGAVSRPVVNRTNIGGWKIDRPALFSRQDAGLLAYLPVMAVLAWCLPEARWDSACRRIAWLQARLGADRFAREMYRFAELLDGHCTGVRGEQLLERVLTDSHRSRLECLRCHHPHGWTPRIRLEGRQHLEDALRVGRGAVLWVAPFSSGEIATKMAFWSAGFRVTHLSRVDHGLSESRFGVRVLNPIWTSVESRYLDERLEMDRKRSATVLKTLIRRVRENRVVSITAGTEGLRCLVVPFLNGAIRLADGPAVLAARTRAALLPVVTERVGPGAFLTTVEEPLSLGAEGREDDSLRGVFVQYAARLAAHVVRQPAVVPRWALRDDEGGLIDSRLTVRVGDGESERSHPGGGTAFVRR